MRLLRISRGECFRSDFCHWWTSFRGQLSFGREKLWTALFDKQREAIFSWTWHSWSSWLLWVTLSSRMLLQSFCACGRVLKKKVKRSHQCTWICAGLTWHELCSVFCRPSERQSVTGKRVTSRSMTQLWGGRRTPKVVLTSKSQGVQWDPPALRYFPVRWLWCLSAIIAWNVFSVAWTI